MSGEKRRRASLLGWDTRRLNQSGYGHSWRVSSVQDALRTARLGCAIYLLRNLKNGKGYVGKAVDEQKRWKQHIKAAEGISPLPIHRAIRKYGLKNFSAEVIHRCAEYKLDAAEKQFIKNLHTHVSEHGYNLGWGGEGGRSDESVYRRIAEANTGKIHGPLQLARRSASLKLAYQLDPTLRFRTGGSWAGKKRTSEDIANRKAALQKYHEDPAWRARVADSVQRSWQNEELRAHRIAAIKAAIRAKWSDPSYREKCVAAARNREHAQ